MRTTPYNEKQLLATRNGLYFNRALQQVMSSDNVNILWNGLTIFGFSLVFCCKTVGNPLFDILSRRNTAFNDGSGYLLRATPSGAGFTLVFGVEDTIPNYTTHSLGYFETGRLYRLTVIIEPFDGNNVWINYKINNQKLTRASFKASNIPVATSQNLFIGGTVNYPGYNLVMDGIIHNVSFYNTLPSERQLEELHTTNVIPNSLHANVIAHYPFNHNTGLKVYDVVEQYNYAKADNSGTWEKQYAMANQTFADGDYLEWTITATANWGIGFINTTRPQFLGNNFGTLALSTETIYFLFRQTGNPYFSPYKNGSLGGAVGGSLATNDVVKILRVGINLDFYVNNVLQGTLVGALTDNVLKYIVVTPYTNNEPVSTINKNGVSLTYTNKYKTAFNASSQIVKTGALSGAHGDLVNYSNDEVGITNPLTQTAWQNIYSKKKDGLNFLKFNGVNGYGKCINFSNVTYPRFSIYYECLAPKNGDVNYSHLFLNSTPGLYKSHTVGIRVSGTNSSIEFLNSVNANQIFISPLASGKIYKGVIVWDGVELNHYPENGVRYLGVSASYGLFEELSFSLYGHVQSYGIGKCILLSQAVDDRGRKLLFNSSSSNDYKNLSNIEIDLNFGDVFYDSGNYFARDSSGNNRHAQLFNWTPVTDQPLRTEQHSGLPERRKALRFNGSSHHITISNFTPTKEKGYTHILGWCLDSNRLFDASFKDILLSKRHNDNSSCRLYFGNPSGNTFSYIENGGAGIFGRNIAFPGDPSKPVFTSSHHIKHVDPSNPRYTIFKNTKHYIFGSYIPFSDDLNGTNDPVGYDSIDGDLYIGSDDLLIGAGRYFNGYIFHVSIYKNVLEQSQIIDIINNGLAGNTSPDLMADCQLYLNFDEIINDAGVFKIRDWSLQNRTVVLNNYSLAEITPGDSSYKLFDLDTLR